MASAAARRATQLSRLCSPGLASLTRRRGLATVSGEHEGFPKVNFWQDPLKPSRWKPEQYIVLSLAGWGALGYGAYNFYMRSKEEKKDEKVGGSRDW